MSWWLDIFSSHSPKTTLYQNMCSCTSAPSLWPSQGLLLNFRNTDIIPNMWPFWSFGCELYPLMDWPALGDLSEWTSLSLIFNVQNNRLHYDISIDKSLYFAHILVFRCFPLSPTLPISFLHSHSSSLLLWLMMTHGYTYMRAYSILCTWEKRGSSVFLFLFMFVYFTLHDDLQLHASSCCKWANTFFTVAQENSITHIYHIFLVTHLLMNI